VNLSLSHGKAILLLIKTCLKFIYLIVLQFNSEQKATCMEIESMIYVLDRGQKMEQKDGV
jgi:hypothetical protein